MMENFQIHSNCPELVICSENVGLSSALYQLSVSCCCERDPLNFAREPFVRHLADGVYVTGALELS